MKYMFAHFPLLLASLLAGPLVMAQPTVAFELNEREYFEKTGLNVMAFQDFYPDGHQGGITIVQNGIRVAANGDLRLEPAPGQWSPVPKMGRREVNREKNEISATLWYPDSSKNRRGFNPILYPDLVFSYRVRVRSEGASICVMVDLEKPLPEAWYGKVGFNIELFPGFYFGKSYYLDEQFGIFPRQANGPVSYDEAGNIHMTPLAKGKKLAVVPEDKNELIEFEAPGAELELIDGRGEHNNGWFIVRTLVKKDRLENAVELLITPHARPDYRYAPVIQVSQVGYHPDQSKIAVVELDPQAAVLPEISLLRASEKGALEKVKTVKPEEWGHFLRYNYLHFDFSEVKKPGIYRVKYGDTASGPFQISEQVYDRHVWQPTLEYYLPVQMCHMRINDRYKVWHGLCHNDDALMAPVDLNHFDGYVQGSSTLTDYAPGDPVPGLNVGGWHDAGDYDLRVESQARTLQMLAYMHELFGPDYDETTVDQAGKVVEMHRPDGKSDILQQIEHGALTLVGGYKALGRLYRGIICSDLRQYTLLGDGSVMTDNVVFRGEGKMDDRWVFTEENPRRELMVAACLATAYSALKGYNDSLATACLDIAEAIWVQREESGQLGLIPLAAELFVATQDLLYADYLIDHQEQIAERIAFTGPAVARVTRLIDNQAFTLAMRTALSAYAAELAEKLKATPYGVEYTPDIWGAGWGIQRFGVDQYFLHRAFPDLFDAAPVFSALNFVLGVHPGSNTASFVSGVGAHSIIVAYGVNRDEWSYIPGGSVSGTALIRPDLPELKEWPYFWQQTEYVMGGGATHFMFLVLAAKDMLGE